MATGNFENWAGNVADIGAIYPFVGSEGLLWIIGVVLWILWHIVQSRIENQHHEEEIQRFGSQEKLKELVARESPENP
jgi:hypothetical protein